MFTPSSQPPGRIGQACLVSKPCCFAETDTGVREGVPVGVPVPVPMPEFSREVDTATFDG